MAGEEGLAIAIIGVIWTLMKFEEQHRNKRTEQDIDIADFYAILTRVFSFALLWISAKFVSALEGTIANLALAYGLITFIVLILMVFRILDKDV